MRVLRTCCPSIIAALAFISFSTIGFCQTPPANGYQISVIGPTGPNYEFYNGTGITRYSGGLIKSPVGHVMGNAVRYGPNGEDLGFEAWHYKGTTQTIGVSGPEYQYETPSGDFLERQVIRMNAIGQVAGWSYRFNAAGERLGLDPWVFDGTNSQLIGFYGPGYETTFTGPGGGVARYGHVLEMNDTGQVIGDTARYAPNGALLGRDGWRFDGSTSQQIGLIGPTYDRETSDGIFRYTAVSKIDRFGKAIGWTWRHNGTASSNSSSRDAWYFDGSTTQMIGLTGGAYEYTGANGVMRAGSAEFMSDVGRVGGGARRYSQTGEYRGGDAWIFDGTSTFLINPTGPSYEFVQQNGGIRRFGNIDGMNKTGLTVGKSTRYTQLGYDLGQDTWVFDGVSTHLIGLMDGEYQTPSPIATGEVYRYSDVWKLNESGHAIGMSERLATNTTFIGRDTWFFDGETTRAISLSGGVYEYFDPINFDIVRMGAPYLLNELDQVIGTNKRFSASGEDLGQSGWFYNLETDTTTALEFSSRTTDNFSYTNPIWITETGVVLGNYQLFDGDELVGNRVFWWSDEAGFFDLGSLVDGGLTAAGWESLGGHILNAERAAGLTPEGAPLYISGFGRVIGQTGGQSTFIMSVPEPSSLSVFGLLSVCIWRRSGRRMA